jgi:CheY-like chemotaxis protein
MKNILVVDDNYDIVETISSRLYRHVKGCMVLTGANGEEGESILRSTPVDLILTDLSMPVMDGYMLIERARRDFPSVPVCVMTSDCSAGVVTRLLSLGVGRWIQKPFRLEKLAKMIAEELHLKIKD